ncbi:MAG TPA: thiamine pyrophosphate-dependent enzyme [Chlorobaculum sp.]|nr:thiamine pyrophosphate-dependent enzyme [Chlorobaculum sp.]
MTISFDPASLQPKGAAHGQVAVAEAAGRALVDAGVAVVNCVPATGAASIFEAWKRLSGQETPYHYHEEVAMGMAMGVSLTGRRSAVVIKAHGFAKAGNAMVDAWTFGAEGGVVVIVAADREGRSSDTIFDPDSLVAGTKLPFLRLGPDEVYGGIIDAFIRSESMGMPVVILVEDDDLAGYIPAPPVSSRPVRPVVVPARDPLRHTLFPGNSNYPHEVALAKLAGRDWRAIPRPELPLIPDGLPEKFHAAIRAYMPVFDLLKGFRDRIDFIMGDTGTSSLFVCPPYNIVDATTYYGGSIPMAAGAISAGARKVWAIIGDWTFTAAGHLGLHEAFHQRLPVKVLIFHNRAAVATGGQLLDEALFERLLDGYREFVTRVDVGDNAKLPDTLQSAQGSGRMEIVVVDFV